MEKSSSVIAAFEAGKLPSTQQVNNFIDWLNDVGIAQVEPSAQGELSTQGRVLAQDLRAVLDAYKQFGQDKNSDNILQKAIWHLTEGDLTVTEEAEANKDQALKDLDAIRRSLRSLLSVVWTSISAEGTSLFQDIFSAIRLSLADAAELIEQQAGSAKEGLRTLEDEVQDGKRDTLGRDKQRLEEEKDPKVAWQHGMDTVKNAGTSLIGTAQESSATIEEKTEQTSQRLNEAFYKITDKAQSDPKYGKALDTIFDILQKRLNAMINAAADPNATLSTFMADPTPEQHIPKALSLLREFVERLANHSMDPLIKTLRSASASIAKDEDLKKWFDDFFALTRRALSEQDFARSDEATQKRKELRIRWRTQIEKDATWKDAVEKVKVKLSKFDQGMRNDKDLNAIKDANAQLGADIETGLVRVGKVAGEKAADAAEAVTERAVDSAGGIQAAVEQATWFWQDLFKVYLPKFLSKMKDVPIPRTEYKDSEIEFVLENLDISSFNILPSHVYIRNIMDVDIQTSANPAAPSHTKYGALTHIKIQALQLELNDVSFWYLDKTASALGPSEFTGLLGLKLPEKGIDVDLKVRLIPVDVKGAQSRQERRHFHVIERCSVAISEDVGIDVRDSNHAVIMALFRPIMVTRLREALEKTLSEQMNAAITYADGVAYDVSERREVFADTGLGSGSSLLAAMWSELGKLERERRAGPLEMDWTATGTGVVVEQRKTVGADEFGEGGRVEKTQFAMGAEPQILSGEKRGPMGTGSEPIRDKIARVGEEYGVTDALKQTKGSVSEAMDVDVDAQGIKQNVKDAAGAVQDKAQGLLKEGKRQVQGFRNSVDRKLELERGRQGWESAAFDV
jgi:hypothetical protein